MPPVAATSVNPQQALLVGPTQHTGTSGTGAMVTAGAAAAAAADGRTKRSYGFTSQQHKHHFLRQECELVKRELSRRAAEIPNRKNRNRSPDRSEGERPAEEAPEAGQSPPQLQSTELPSEHNHHLLHHHHHPLHHHDHRQEHQNSFSSSTHQVAQHHHHHHLHHLHHHHPHHLQHRYSVGQQQWLLSGGSNRARSETASPTVPTVAPQLPVTLAGTTAPPPPPLAPLLKLKPPHQYHPSYHSIVLLQGGVPDAILCSGNTTNTATNHTNTSSSSSSSSTMPVVPASGTSATAAAAAAVAAAAGTATATTATQKSSTDNSLFKSWPPPPPPLLSSSSSSSVNRPFASTTVVNNTGPTTTINNITFGGSGRGADGSATDGSGGTDLLLRLVASSSSVCRLITTTTTTNTTNTSTILTSSTVHEPVDARLLDTILSYRSTSTSSSTSSSSPILQPSAASTLTPSRTPPPPPSALRARARGTPSASNSLDCSFSSPTTVSFTTTITNTTNTIAQSRTVANGTTTSSVSSPSLSRHAPIRAHRHDEQTFRWCNNNITTHNNNNNNNNNNEHTNTPTNGMHTVRTMKSLNITVNVEESFTQATIKLRPAASSRSSTAAATAAAATVVATTATITSVSNGGSGSGGTSTSSSSGNSVSVVVPGRSPKPATIATVSATTDDLRRAGESAGGGGGAKDGDFHVTATIRIKPRAAGSSSSSSTTTATVGTSRNGSSTSTSSSSSSSSNSLNCRTHAEDEEGNQQNNNSNSHLNSNGASDGHSRRASNAALGTRRGSNSSNINAANNNNNNNGYSEPVESSSSSASSSSESASHNGAGASASGDGARALNGHDHDLAADDDKLLKAANEDGRVNYQLRTGTSAKGLSSTSGSYRSSKDYDSAYRVPSSGSGSSVLQKSSYDTDYDVADSVRGRKEGLCGLWNIGNTCFMNSIIQCLSHTRELTAFLRSQPSTERGTNKDHRILAEYTKLIKDVWSGTQRSVNPSELKYAFSSKHRMYSGSAQQDAQEFLRFFLDSLHGALNVAVKRDPLGDIDDDMNNRVKADLLWNWYSKAENSMIKDLFVGQLRSTLKCTYCGTESTMFDPFWDLSLPLPSSNSRCKLENCLEMFIKEEILDGIDQPTCSKCNTRRKCTKSLTIERFPKYLVIHLKRFSETRWSKLTNIIEFPTGDRELNLQPYASEDNLGPVNYSLYGISNHMGSTAGGHYIAVCKHPITKEWNEFNDNFVSETTERSLVTSSAYVLFYERA
ncbi:ubiquitin carboxyl-terminal hydrolase Usp2-like isoform X1 [Anopheles albimanus]|uniref:ubiquitin carboxyl-terminal hydrolase Usp2-like isoform X1 n=1 Tax=Anopheles albimanus TaxID=7167 RepID=UPI00163EAD5D|nr:ubiquitin carboxyl-terminal hydrolase Usp2-like isoform X1 [Anopheles albimanus]